MLFISYFFNLYSILYLLNTHFFSIFHYHYLLLLSIISANFLYYHLFLFINHSKLVFTLNKVELLSPAKNMKALKAAIPNSDAIYFGIKGFNMRQNADNFDLSELASAVKFCHDNNVKAILATNILVYDNELDQLRFILESAYYSDIDAAIVHDFAAIQIAQDLKLPFHISTQCNVSNSLSAQFYEKLGASYIILARECSLKQIKSIKKNLRSAKIEAFIHGAMCSAVSGRCYLSATICGSDEKSANRGRCTQPCRRSWRVFDNDNHEFIFDGTRFMNSRDLCMVHHIPEMIEAGIDAFKIEGRMRDPYYVDVVSSIYRQAIEAYYNNSFSKKKASLWIKELRKVYNRGFTTGFYFKRPTEFDHQHKSPSNLSHYRLIKIATITQYDPNSQLASISLFNGKIFNKLQIIVMGDYSSDTYFKQKIHTILLNNSKVNSSPYSSPQKPLSLQIKLSQPAKPLSDHIYVFSNYTYKNRSYYFKSKKSQSQTDYKPSKSDFYLFKSS